MGGGFGGGQGRGMGGGMMGGGQGGGFGGGQQGGAAQGGLGAGLAPKDPDNIEDAETLESKAPAGGWVNWRQDAKKKEES